jgi:uncharacterized protein YkwD
MFTILTLALLSQDLTSKSVCDNLNVVRANAGSGPMYLDKSLCEQCKTHAQQCAARGTIFHSANRGTGVLEGVCYYFRDPVYALATPQTPDHRQDAINRRCTRLGVGYAYSRSGVIYWVLQYAP